MTKKIKRIVAVVAIVASSAGLWSFVDNDFKLTKNIDIFLNLFRELNYNYVDDVDPEKLLKSGIDGMLRTLDPYTTFIAESDLDNFKFQTTGQYGGIGALIRKMEEYVVIAEPYENFPAQKAGLRAGDKLVKIDGKDVKNKNVSDVSEMLKGIPNTEVRVEYLRAGSNKTEVTKITRERITIPNVPYYGIIRDSIGYIRLTNFTSDAGEETKKALLDLKQKGAKAIVLDLRGNPGGLLIEAVNVANNFINKDQLVVYTKGKVKETYKTYNTFFEPVDTIIPLAVLISRGSASAAEIVAGALQDLDRAIIIGQRSFGKGLVQQTRPLSYNTQLKVTTAKYYIPSGRCIQALDYAHRNEDGSVGYVPDSLIKEFKTKKGRIVRDGGGIMPDLITKNDRLSDITFNLYSKNLFFDFATEFATQNVQIPNMFKFEIDSTIYLSFTNFLENKDFDYTTRTEEALKELISNAKKERYFQGAVDEFKLLAEKLGHDKALDLQTYKPEIAQLLKEEIVSRYYYQKGKIVASLSLDKEFDKAVEIFNTNDIYRNILNGTYKDLTNTEEAKVSSNETDEAEIFDEE